MNTKSLNILTAHSAFNTCDILVIDSLIELDNINDIFGVFTTIIRKDELNSNKVHGCLGYFNKTSITSDLILEKIMTLVYNTNYTDNRRLNFKKELLEDSSAIIEINLMRLPLYNIDSNTGIINIPDENGNVPFDNNKYGIIVNNTTYLPHVFDNISFPDIKKSLLIKSGLNKANTPFQTYLTYTISFSIYDQFFSNDNINLILSNVYKFYLLCDSSFIPYEYNQILNKIRIDKLECVRNLSSICDFIKLTKSNDLTKFNIEDMLEYYYSIFTISTSTATATESLDQIAKVNNISQGSIFLLLAYHLINNKVTDKMINIITYLSKRLPIMNKEFELGEALMILTIINNSKDLSLSELILSEQSKMFDSLKQRTSFVLNDVFELNWHMQFLKELIKSNTSANILDHIKLIYDILIKILNNELKKDELETNYIVVIFEMLCALYKSIDNIYIKDKLQEFYVLAYKRLGKHNLYYFSDMETARLDITGHFMSGLFTLIKFN